MPNRTTPLSGSGQPAVEEIRGGTRIRMTMIIVIGVLIAVIVGAVCILLHYDAELQKSYGGTVVQALLYLLFTLLGALGVNKFQRGND